MLLKKLGPSVTTLTLHDGTVILFSYDTPVACHIPGKGYFRTHITWSNTTTKHINAWCPKGAMLMDQSELEALVKPGE